MLENRMIEACSLLLFGKGKSAQAPRSFFSNEIMATSHFSYAFKRQVFTRLLDQMTSIEPEDLKKLKSGLNNLMVWRNAFAHGQVITVAGKGLTLRYYRNGHQTELLNDAFFEKVESTIKYCLQVSNSVIAEARKCT